MDLIGKAPPNPTSLRATAARGFDGVELYLTTEDLDSVEATATAVERSPVDAVTVHTPHVIPDDETTFRRSDELAQRLGAYLVVHSQYLQHLHVPKLESYGFEAPYGHEINSGVSVFHLRNVLFENGHDLVLDTAHLYTAEPSYLEAMETLLRDHGEQIRVVHLTDGTRTNDGLAIGSGDIDLETTTHLLDQYYDGTVVIEVMPDEQRAGLQTVRDWLS